MLTRSKSRSNERLGSDFTREVDGDPVACGSAHVSGSGPYRNRSFVGRSRASWRVDPMCDLQR